MTASEAPQPSVFTRILHGELPGRFVYRQDDVAAVLTIAPIAPGHTLIIPSRQVDNWLDLSGDLRDRLFAVAQWVGQAIDRAWRPERVALVVAGFEVPHVHLHLIPVSSEAEISFARADPTTPGAALDAAAEKLRAALATDSQGVQRDR